MHFLPLTSLHFVILFGFEFSFITFAKLGHGVLLLMHNCFIVTVYFSIIIANVSIDLYLGSSKSVNKKVPKANLEI